MKSADLILSILNRLVDIGERAYGMAVASMILSVLLAYKCMVLNRRITKLEERKP